MYITLKQARRKAAAYNAAAIVRLRAAATSKYGMKNRGGSVK